jgi:hypothetical protein
LEIAWRNLSLKNSSVDLKPSEPHHLNLGTPMHPIQVEETAKESDEAYGEISAQPKIGIKVHTIRSADWFPALLKHLTDQDGRLRG